jgi:hypothetical protein
VKRLAPLLLLGLLLPNAPAAEPKRDQYASHYLRAESEKMSPIRPFNIVNINQAKIDLVDQSSRLECMSRALVHHAPPCGALQLSIENGGKLVQRVRIPRAPGTQ